MPDELVQEFLTALWRLQAERGLSNRALAQRVGLSPAYIGRLKRGARGRRLGLGVAVRIAQAFPELAFFLTSTSHILTTTVQEGSEAEVREP